MSETSSDSLLYNQYPLFSSNQAWKATLDGEIQLSMNLHERAKEIFGIRAVNGNYAITCLIAGLPDKAVSLYDEFYEAANKGGSKLSGDDFGSALWIAGRRQEACTHWAQTIDEIDQRIVTNTRGAGGVLTSGLLYWASSYDGLGSWEKIAIDGLKRRWKTKTTKDSKWPGSVARLILFDQPLDEYFEYAEDIKYENVKLRQLCQAHFYAAAWLHKRQRDNEAMVHMRQAAERPVPDVILETEYHLARHELSIVGW
jgi:hypothetical protein